jgi:hypothetical protein
MGKNLLCKALGKIALKFIEFFSDRELFGDIFSRPGQIRSAILAIVAAGKIKMATVSTLNL